MYHDELRAIIEQDVITLQVVDGDFEFLKIKEEKLGKNAEKL